MSYITISELPELLETDVNGEEYFLVTDSNNNSTRIKMSTIADYVGSVEVSPLSIQDEGISVGTTNIINFIGADVSSYMNNNKNRIDVYIPSAQISSNFNTTNGQSNATVIDNNIKYQRYIGMSNLYYVGDWDRNTKYSVIKQNLSFSVNDFFKVSSTGKIIVKIINDSVLTVETFTDSGKTLQENGITIDITDFGTELNYNICKLNVSVDVSNISGRFRIEIVNICEGNEYTYVSEDMFCDNSSKIAGINFDYNLSNISYKYLTGIKYISYGTKIDYSAVLTNPNSYSYPENITDIDGTLCGLSLYNVNKSDFQNYIGDESSDENYGFSNNININKYYNGNILIKSRVNDWSSGNWESVTKRALIDTYVDSSTRIYEDFVSETNRLRVQNLLTFDSLTSVEDGELQVTNSRLVYPQLDFSEFNGNPSYSDKSGERAYIRKFWHTGTSHSNGVFQIISNITESDLSNDNIKILISLDSINWYSLNSEYFGGVLNNNDGCRINVDTNNLNNNKLEFTLGLNKFTASESSWGIYVKVIFSETAKDKYIDSLQIINWN